MCRSCDHEDAERWELDPISPSPRLRCRCILMQTSAAKKMRSHTCVETVIIKDRRKEKCCWSFEITKIMPLPLNPPVYTLRELRKQTEHSIRPWKPFFLSPSLCRPLRYHWYYFVFKVWFRFERILFHRDFILSFYEIGINI